MKTLEIIKLMDEIYNNYITEVNKIIEGYKSGDLLGTQPHIEKMFSNSDELIPLTQEEFINKCKTDNNFANKWNINYDNIF